MTIKVKYGYSEETNRLSEISLSIPKDTNTLLKFNSLGTHFAEEDNFKISLTEDVTDLTLKIENIHASSDIPLSASLINYLEKEEILSAKDLSILRQISTILEHLSKTTDIVSSINTLKETLRKDLFSSETTSKDIPGIIDAPVKGIPPLEKKIEEYLQDLNSLIEKNRQILGQENADNLLNLQKKQKIV